MAKNHKIQSGLSCKLCQATHATSLDPPMSHFCFHCRAHFAIDNNRDAEEMLGWIDAACIETGAQDVKCLEKPEVDPIAVAAGVRTMVDYKVAPVTSLEKTINYVVYKNGLFEVRQSDLATVVVKPKEVLGVLEEAKEGVQLNIPKIPFEFLLQIISFFREVCVRQKGSSEALVQIWWDKEGKTHQIHVPVQEVSGGGVHHTSTFDQGAEGRWLHVADIHSHGSSMGAFWSGTDNADEARVITERLFGVIGKVAQPIPEWRWRMRTRDGFIDLSVDNIFQTPKDKLNFTVDFKTIFQSLGSNSYKDGEVQLWCPVDPFKSVEVPEAWYDQVQSFSERSKGKLDNAAPHLTGNRQNHQAFPKNTEGFIYISGNEYLVDQHSMRATGHRLIRREERRHEH